MTGVAVYVNLNEDVMSHYPEYENILIHAGQYFTAEWYCEADGGLPAFEYYTALPQLDQDRFDDMLRYLCVKTQG